MSIIDHQRHSSASGRNKRPFFSLRSRNSKSSERPFIFNALPNIEKELSLADLEKSNEADGRCLRIFCEKVKEGSYFKTLFVRDNTTVGECISALVHLIFEPSECNQLVNPESLVMFETVGRIRPNTETAADQKRAGQSIAYTEFTEVGSHALAPSQRVIEVFSLMTPAPGLSRRLELRPKQPPARHSTAPKTDRLSSEMTSFGQGRLSPSPHPNGTDRSPDVQLLRNRYSSTTLAHQPHLLLLKGSRPERDALVHDVSPLFSGSKDKLSIGLSSKEDIRLYLAPGSKRSKSGSVAASPASLCVRDAGKRKVLCLVISAQWKLPQSAEVITVFHNRLDVSKEIPLERHLQPGDILRFEASELAYIFLFKDPSSVPEHELKLAFLSTPPVTPATPSPIATPNSNRSALRTARISASRDSKTGDRLPPQRTSSSTSSSATANTTGSCPASEVFPSNDSVNPVLRMLFADSGSEWANEDCVTFIMPKPWTGFPNVAVAAACYAHFTRSAAIAYAATLSSERHTQRALEQLLGTVGSTLTNEIDALESVTTKHLVPAVWKVAFCFYTSQYLTAGWLQPTLMPREEPRDSWALETPEAETNGEARISPAEAEFMPEVAKLRDLTVDEADRALDSAVQHTLGVLLEDVTAMCQMFGNSSRVAEKGRLAQQRLFDKLGQVRDNITVAVSGAVGDYPVTLAQAEVYMDNQENGSTNDSSNRSVTTASSDVDSASYSEEAEDITGGRSDTKSSAPRHYQPSPSDQSKNSATKPPTPATDVFKQMPISSAQSFIEETFFRRLLHGISTHIIEQFLDNPKLNIDFSTGRQLLAFIRSLDTWMTKVGIKRYKEPLRMIYQFAKLLSTERETLFQMRVQDMRRKFSEIPVPVLYFMVENYENGQGIQQAEVWQYDDVGTISYDDSPGESLAECTRIWKRDDRLKPRDGRRGRVDQHGTCNKPLDLASLFHLAETKDVINKFDEELGKQEVKFRWTRLLRHYPPPGLHSTSNITNNADSPIIHTARIRSREASTSRANRDRSVGSFNRSGTNIPNGLGSVTRPTTLEFGAALLPAPILSDGRPIRSTMGFRTPTYCASEIGGTRDVRKNSLSSRYTPNPRIQAVRLAGMYDLGRSSPYLAGDAINARHLTTRYHGTGGGGCGSLLGISRPPNRFASAANLARSTEFDMVDGEEVRRVREDWSQFKKESSRPPSPTADDLGVTLRRPPQLPMEQDFDFEQSFSSAVGQKSAKHRNGSAGHYPLMTESVSEFPYPRLQLPPNRLSRAQSGLSINTTSLAARPNTLEVARSLRGSTSHLGLSREFGRQGSQTSLLGVDAVRTPESTIFNVILQREGNESFGLNLVEGHKTSLDQPGIYITNVTPNSPADRSNNLILGDRILAINGTDLTGLTYKESVALLKASKERIALTIQKRGLVNPEALLELKS